MLDTKHDQWAAFTLSLIAPGSGQLLAGSWTALVWFGALAGAAVILALMERTMGLPVPVLAQTLAFLVIGLLSAMHARTQFESSPWGPSGRAKSSLECDRGLGNAIAARIVIQSRLCTEELWERVRDLQAFLTIDPFHERVVLMREQPAQGVHLVLQHNAFGWRFKRYGRILQWEDGSGYAFSDLSARGKAVGFPHVFYVRVSACEAGPFRSQLVVEVKGRWTARFVPTWLGRLWIRAVCWDHARLLRRAL